jgi:hypothetical protein
MVNVHFIRHFYKTIRNNNQIEVYIIIDVVEHFMDQTLFFDYQKNQFSNSIIRQ